MVDRIKRSQQTFFDVDELAAEVVKHGGQSEEKDAEKVNGANLERLLRIQGGRCYYTGKVLTFNNVSVDHKQPLSKGGKHVMSNIALCLKVVNTMKGQMTESQFIAICKAISKR